MDKALSVRKQAMTSITELAVTFNDSKYERLHRYSVGIIMTDYRWKLLFEIGNSVLLIQGMMKCLYNSV